MCACIMGGRARAVCVYEGEIVRVCVFVSVCAREWDCVRACMCVGVCG